MSKLEKIILLSAGVILTIAILIGSTYSYIRFEGTQTNANQIVSKCFDLSFEENANSNITLKETYPMSEVDGSKLTPYTFTINNHCNNEANYQINLESLISSDLSEEYIRVKVNERESSILGSLRVTDKLLEESKKSFVIEEGVINANETKTVEVRLWLDEGVNEYTDEAMNKSYFSKISVEGSYKGYKGKYTEDILNGTDPILKDNLVPVTIANDGKVYKADETKEWYSYEKKQWANAVILEDETIQYNNGETIPESNIESYFVWIPRYRYQIFNDGLYYGLSDTVSNQAQEIKVVFESKERQISDGVRKGSWLTHPAFTSFDVNGIWVGKYETGYKEATTKVEGEQNIVDSNKIQIKPNVYSWRGINVANAHLNSKNYKSNLDSHMMKNTEWGAVAYLANSKYGNKNKIRNNNNNIPLTGFSSVNEPTCGYTRTNELCNQYGSTGDITQSYNTNVGVLASTTGNISGIYDMSGGSWEMVMAVMSDKNSRLISGRSLTNNSGFNGQFSCPTCDGASGELELTTGIDYPDSKYYDLYAYNEDFTRFSGRILGDATGEGGPFGTTQYLNVVANVSSWQNQRADFAIMNYPGFVRGGNYNDGISSGVFATYVNFGPSPVAVTYRIVFAF